MSYSISRALLSCLVAASLFCASAAQAAFDTFMEFKGGNAPETKGESNDAQFPDTVEVFSFSWGASNPVALSGGGGMAAGRVSISSFNFMKRFDAASPSLFTACASGQHYDEVKVTLRKAGESKTVFLIYTFKNVFVESTQWSGSSGGDDVPTESVSLSFGQVSMEYRMPSPQGTQSSKAGWDLIKNEKFTP